MRKKIRRQPRIFTIGHSDRTLDEFLLILERSSVRLVADVRSNPASVRFPWFERTALGAELERRGLSYRWFRELGGRRPATAGEELHTAFTGEQFRRYAAAMGAPEFTHAAQELFGLGASAISAVLCAEKDPADCHRLLLADKLQLLGARVVHILDIDRAVEHHLHPDLVMLDDQLLYKKRQLDLLGTVQEEALGQERDD